MRLRPLAIALTAAAAALAGSLVAAEPARAATADQWGFAYVDNPTAPAWTTLDPAHQWGTWKTAFPLLWADGIKIATGRFLVRFPQIGLGARGNVHVTPVNRTGEYCEVVRWGQSGADEIVDVQCHKPGGAPADTRFTVLWTYSSGVLTPPPPVVGAYGSVQYGPGFIVQSYNSTGGFVSVIPLAVGLYEVKWGGVGMAGALGGDVQVTAVQPNAQARRCKVYKWGPAALDIIAYVSCFDATGARINSEFTASYHRERTVVASFAPPKYFGYIWASGPATTNFNYPAGGFGFNSVSPIAPVGRYLVKYPFLGQWETHAQVTAAGGNPDYCNLTQLWSHLGGDAQVDVICFDNAGTYKPNDFLTTFTNSA